MWEFLTTIITNILNKEDYMNLFLGLIIGILLGGLSALGYFNYTGSVLKFKKDKPQ